MRLAAACRKRLAAAVVADIAPERAVAFLQPPVVPSGSPHEPAVDAVGLGRRKPPAGVSTVGGEDEGPAHVNPVRGDLYAVNVAVHGIQVVRQHRLHPYVQGRRRITRQPQPSGKRVECLDRVLQGSAAGLGEDFHRRGEILRTGELQHVCCRTGRCLYTLIAGGQPGIVRPVEGQGKIRLMVLVEDDIAGSVQFYRLCSAGGNQVSIGAA